jgi:hypothetical protein
MQSPKKDQTKRKLHTVKAAAEQVPDWFKTVPDYGYALIIWDNNEGCDVEQVKVTRSEYLEIKRHIARLRGLKTVPEREAADVA